MAPITTTARRIFDESNDGALKAALAQLFGARNGEAYLEAESAAMRAAAESGDDFDALDAALNWSDDDNRCISTVLNDERWSAVLAQEVLDMQVTDGCGADCFALIIAADFMLSSMADVEQFHADDVRAAVARQCGVFYFG